MLIYVGHKVTYVDLKHKQKVKKTAKSFDKFQIILITKKFQTYAPVNNQEEQNKLNQFTRPLKSLCHECLIDFLQNGVSNQLKYVNLFDIARKNCALKNWSYTVSLDNFHEIYRKNFKE